MAGGFFLMCLLVVTVHSTKEVNSTPLSDQTLKKTILEKLLKIEGALAISHKREGLGAVVAQLAVDLQNTKSQIQTTQTELQATRTELQTTRTELQTTRTELQTTRTELRTTQTELQTTRTELRTTQTELQTTRTELQTTRTELQTTRTELQTTRTELQTTKTELGALKDLKSEQGSTFVRWGRKSCPPKTTLVYSGIAGGKHYSSSGSGSNRLCLTPSPQFDNASMPQKYGTLYGGEYEYIPGHHDNDAPCSVCRAAQPTTIMIAGTLTCPAGWTSQYTGHLASERESPDHHSSEYVCLDGNPEDTRAGDRNDNGNLFYYVKTVCGALPCPPYANNKVVTCAVCSK